MSKRKSKAPPTLFARLNGGSIVHVVRRRDRAALCGATADRKRGTTRMGERRIYWVPEAAPTCVECITQDRERTND